MPRYRRENLAGDVGAALIGAAVLVPQSMAYAQIAQLPPITGLYASVVPLLVYSVVGRTPQLGIGPLATISILSAVGVAKLAPQSSSEFIALSATLAVLVGIVHVAIGVLRLGFIVRFLSEPVMSGFLSAIAVLLIATQLGPLTGVPVGSDGGRVDDIVVDWVRHLDEGSVATFLVGAAAIVVLLVAHRWRRLPTALMVVIAGSLAAWGFDLDSHGVAIVGEVPSGLALPETPPWNWDDIRTLLPTAFAITMISLLESVSLGREFADERHREFDTNREIGAIGASNVVSGFVRGMVVTSAISRSTILDQAGARTQLTGALTALVVAPLVMFGTATFEYIPTTVLAAVVIAAMLPLVKVGEFRRLWSVHRGDFWVMLLAFAGTILLGLEPGVLLAIGASIALLVYRVSRPRIPELGLVARTGSFLEVQRHPDAVTYPGTVILRMEAALYFTNSDALTNRLRRLEEDRPELHTVVLDASGIDRIDSTGDHALRKLAARYREDGKRLLVVNADEDVRGVMDASGFTELVGRDAFFATDADAIAHLQALTPASPDEPAR